MQRDRLARIMGYALSRREAYLIVVLVFVAALVAIVRGWPVWVPPAAVVVGVVLLALVVVDALTDPDMERDASIADVEVNRVNDPALRAKVRRALDYVRAAHKLARRGSSGSLEAAGAELPQLEQAARSIYQMSLRVDGFRADRLLQQDLADLQSHQGQLTKEQEDQKNSLQRLDALVRSAEAEVDSALALLGRSYAEMQAINVTPEFRGRAVEAVEELGQSTQRLSDLAAGYDEVYGAQAHPGELETRG